MSVTQPFHPNLTLARLAATFFRVPSASHADHVPWKRSRWGIRLSRQVCSACCPWDISRKRSSVGSADTSGDQDRSELTGRKASSGALQVPSLQLPLSVRVKGKVAGTCKIHFLKQNDHSSDPDILSCDAKTVRSCGKPPLGDRGGSRARTLAGDPETRSATCVADRQRPGDGGRGSHRRSPAPGNRPRADASLHINRFCRPYGQCLSMA